MVNPDEANENYNNMVGEEDIKFNIESAPLQEEKKPTHMIIDSSKLRSKQFESGPNIYEGTHNGHENDSETKKEVMIKKE